jgi:glycosyltransferase involved in cell wall biosynthesis
LATPKNIKHDKKIEKELSYMNVFFVSDGTPSKKYPLYARFQFEQASAVSKIVDGKVFFLEVDLRSFRRFRKWGFSFYEKEGIQVCSVRVPCGRIPARLLNEIGVLAFRRLYKKTVKKFGLPDVVHAHFTRQAYIASKVIGKETPLIVTEHSSAITGDTIAAETKRIAKIGYDRADRNIAVSNALKGNIEKHFDVNDVLVIPNMTDTSQFRYEEGQKTSEQIKVITIGNLIPRKRMNVTIEAFALVKEKFPNATLEICGDGPERSGLEKLSVQKGLQDDVVFAGLCSRQEVRQKLSGAHLFVLASKYEPFGVVYIEALASGIPIVGTRSGGPEDIIHDGNGKLVDVDDPAMLAQAMIAVIENIEQYNPKELADEARLKYSTENIAERIMAVYKECIRR